MANIMNRTAASRYIRTIVLAVLVLTITSAATAQISAAIEKVWIEYGVRLKGETGLRIHTKFSIKKALNVGCSIQATIEREDGGILLTKSIGTVYKADKNVLVLKTFTPPYDIANYADTKLFVPYWALALKAADPNKMKVTVAISGQNKEFANSTLKFNLALGGAD